MLIEEVFVLLEDREDTSTRDARVNGVWKQNMSILCCQSFTIYVVLISTSFSCINPVPVFFLLSIFLVILLKIRLDDNGWIPRLTQFGSREICFRISRGTDRRADGHDESEG